LEKKELKLKIILCGYNWTGCKALAYLIDAGHTVFVFTHKSPYYIPSLIDFCEEKEVAYSTKNISKTELPFKPDVSCSVFYRYIIKDWVIESCNGKIFNLHPSLLPDYKGCSSLTWALINGEKKTGFTYHYIDK
jgi:methionyl-tRNA formyltransferase